LRPLPCAVGAALRSDVRRAWLSRVQLTATKIPLGFSSVLVNDGVVHGQKVC
jgi:hypothetical protein